MRNWNCYRKSDQRCGERAAGGSIGEEGGALVILRCSGTLGLVQKPHAQIRRMGHPVFRLRGTGFGLRRTLVCVW